LGTKLNFLYVLKRQKYKETHKGCFYPQGLLTTLVQLKRNIPHHFAFSRKTFDQSAVAEHLRQIKEGDVIVFSIVKRSKGVAKEVFKAFLPRLWDNSGCVQDKLIEKIEAIVWNQTHQSPAGRSFKRRSRKVISRWQRSTAKQWAKKKHLERQTAEP
jgi:hypothetical protein